MVHRRRTEQVVQNANVVPQRVLSGSENDGGLRAGVSIDGGDDVGEEHDDEQSEGEEDLHVVEETCRVL